MERRSDLADRRRNLVHLTDEGRRVLDEGERNYRDAESAFLGALDAAESQQLKSLLRRVIGVDR